MFDASIFETEWPTRRFDTLDSTNAYAVKLADGGENGPCWIHAESQTAGRGRLGRSWSSPVGNLYATALFPFAGSMSEAPLVCFLAGLAVIDAISDLHPSIMNRIRLKWPNDVVVADKKLAGILIETGSHKGSSWMAVGLGVNLDSAPTSIDRPTIALADLVEDNWTTNPAEFLAVLDSTFRRRLATFAKHGFSSAREDWLQRTTHKGRRLSYVDNGKTLEGDFLDLGEDGALVVRGHDGQAHHVRAGDVGLIG